MDAMKYIANDLHKKDMISKPFYSILNAFYIQGKTIIAILGIVAILIPPTLSFKNLKPKYKTINRTSIHSKQTPLNN